MAKEVTILALQSLLVLSMPDSITYKCITPVYKITELRQVFSMLTKYLMKLLLQVLTAGQLILQKKTNLSIIF